mmetsp:Transcript_51990/g.97263  ORF Transcript_51990/g.97263 Transcript_51990/m.97263 type:complete len:80 (-) Transcript_51990:580-819(-)
MSVCEFCSSYVKELIQQSPYQSGSAHLRSSGPKLRSQARHRVCSPGGLLIQTVSAGCEKGRVSARYASHHELSKQQLPI